MNIFSSFCIAVTTFLISSCTEHPQNAKILEDLNKSNESMIRLLETDLDLVYEYFEASIRDEATKSKAERWYPKATILKKMSFDALNFIDSLKNDFLVKNGNTPTKDEVEQYFIKDKKGDLLFNRITSLENNILKLDSLLLEPYQNKNLILDKELTANTFVDKYFDDVTLDELMAFFTYLKVQTKFAELKVAQLMSQLWTNHIQEHYTSYSAIVSINSKHFKVGDEIIITAGVGSFSVSKSNKFTIYGSTVNINENGEAIFKMKAPSSIGRHSIPVTIELMDEDGNKQKISKYVEYRITRN